MALFFAMNCMYFSKADTVKGFTYFELATEDRV